MVEAVLGTNCTDNKPTGSGIVQFTNPPLYDLQVNFRDGGSGETSATIECVPLELADSTTPPDDWDTSATYEDESAPQTVVCTIVVDLWDSTWSVAGTIPNRRASVRYGSKMQFE